VINDMRAGHATRVMWSEDGERIYFSASSSGITTIQSVDLQGNVREEAGGRRRIFDFDVAKGTLAFCASDTTNPGELFMVSGGAEARLSDLNPWLHDRYVAQPEQEYFTAPDGWRLEGWVLKPPGFDPNKLHPAVLEIHGGPHAQYGWSFFHELQILAGMGFVVFYLNPRGSDGYGENFRRSVVRDWAGKDYVDLMSSLDQIIERTGYIDATRVGVGGGSYGGYMTNWIIGQTDRFAAAVSMRSISNLVSEYPQHDIVLWGTLQLGPPPWPNLDELWRRSPIRYVQNMRTPLLLTAGEMDLRCAMSQSEELFGAMRLLGKTVELVRFPEESHDLSRNGRPDRRVERLRRIAGWYEKYLGTNAVDRPAPEEATQILEVPVAAAHEWAKTVAINREDADVAATLTMDAPPLEAEVIQPTVPETATQEAPIAEPEALPDLPLVDEPAAAEGVDAPTQTAPVVGVSEPVEEAGPEPVAAPEPEPEPVPEPVAVAEPEPEPVPEPVAVAAQEPEPEAEPQPELVSAVTEPVLSAFEEPVSFVEPAVPMPEPAEPAHTEPEPEPVSAFTPETEPEPLPPPAPEPVAQPEPQPVAASASGPGIGETLVAWPSGAGAPAPENGTPAQPSVNFDEATSVIPAWQQTAPDSKQTVSMQAMPLEEVASGSGFAAILTFESGPFSGRIVALPNQMVSIGRAPDNDVVVGDPATSGHHGRIEVRGGSFWISDLGSTNGTLVNGQPVIEQQLSDGDMIAIGQNTLRFTLEA
jgi:hypothetical protein